MVAVLNPRALRRNTYLDSIIAKSYLRLIIVTVFLVPPKLLTSWYLHIHRPMYLSV